MCARFELPRSNPDRYCSLGYLSARHSNLTAIRHISSTHARGTLMNRLVIFALLISAIGTHAESAAPPDSPRGHVPAPPASLDRVLANLIAANGVLTAGVGVIDDG